MADEVGVDEAGANEAMADEAGAAESSSRGPIWFKSTSSCATNGLMLLFRC